MGRRGTHRDWHQHMTGSARLCTRDMSFRTHDMRGLLYDSCFLRSYTHNEPRWARRCEPLKPKVSVKTYTTSQGDADGDSMTACLPLLGDARSPCTRPSITEETLSSLQEVDQDWMRQALAGMCRAAFFHPCPRHPQQKKNESNFYVWSSYGSFVCCRHCMEEPSNFHGDLVFQIRRYMHREVVLVEDLSKVRDCRGIQSYYINQKKAVLLSPKEQQADSTPAFDTTCVTCDVPLRPDCMFCSLICELNASGEAVKHCGGKVKPKRRRQENRASNVPPEATTTKSGGKARRALSREWARKMAYPMRSPMD